jgi:hypothetical protein
MRYVATMRGTCSPWQDAHEDETVGTTKTIGIDKHDPAQLVGANCNDKNSTIPHD